jgi:hypothetical protein
VFASAISFVESKGELNNTHVFVFEYKSPVQEAFELQFEKHPKPSDDSMMFEVANVGIVLSAYPTYCLAVSKPSIK